MRRHGSGSTGSDGFVASAANDRCGFQVGRGWQFTVEADRRKALIGDRTSSRLRTALGPTLWEGWTAKKRDKLVAELLAPVSDADLLARLLDRGSWALEAAAAERLLQVDLEDGYCALSLRALGKIVPHLERGANPVCG